MKKLMLTTASMLSVAVAQAHVSVVSDTAYANGYYAATLAVPHGCDGMDTIGVEVEVPANFGTPRVFESALGKGSVAIEGETGNYILTWTKAEGTEQYAEDDHAYEVSFRTRLPDTPFTTVYFPTRQFCESPVGATGQSDWVGTGGHGHDHGGGGGESEELPAPSMMIYPARYPGWNTYEVTEHLHDMSIFNDAEIVWWNDAAYSSNPLTLELIEEDANTSVLEQIHPADEGQDPTIIWVKY